MGVVSSSGGPGPGDQSRVYGSGYEQKGWPSREPRSRRQHVRPAPAGPWTRLPPGYTIAALAGPVHPLCGHASPVRPGSDVWADDCAELAEYSRPFAGFPPGCDEYACAQHARCPDSPGRLAWGITD
jgi:hypothetical protein